jgi:predicted CXXCH cytochrome family protein
MWQSWQYFLSLTGFGLMIAGIFLLVQMPVTAESLSADYIKADYVGERECASCHGSMARNHRDTTHGLALFKADNTDKILGDFNQQTMLLMLQLPDEDSARLITLNDVAYVVGAGRYVQRYLIETAPNQYMVLPFEWDVTTNTWQAFTLGEEWPDEAYDWNTNCAYCHVTNFDAEQGSWQDDGVQCEACHGPGSYHVDLADEIGRIESPEDREAIANSINIGIDAQTCGQCHSQGTAIDSQLPYPLGYIPSMNLEDTFTLAPTTDTSHWWRSGHARQTNMQYNEWLLSGHGNAFSTLPEASRDDPTCLVCHSEAYRYTERISANADFLPSSRDEAQRLNVGITCATCHDVHEDEASNAYLRDEPNSLCAECHSNGDLNTVHHPTVEMYTGQTLVENIPGIPTTHVTVENGPTCTTCHMTNIPTGNEQRVTHTFSPVMPAMAEAGQPDTCTSCHSDLTTAYSQRFITNQQSKTLRRILDIQSLLENGEYPAWVSDAAGFVSGDGSLGIHNVAYTETLLDSLESTLGLVNGYNLNAAPILPVIDPLECAECHADEYRHWLDSSHANASLMPNFQNYFASIGRPGYCLRCHASGYNPLEQNYQFDGVVCTNCHLITDDVQHPPAPISVAKDATICGACHSGGHASVYEEWLASSHNQVGVDCIDCHTAHDNGLILDDVNSTCGDCHAAAMEDEVHMGEDMSCIDCHMTPRQTVTDPTMLTRTGHTMHIDPGVCADCHGETHMLSIITDGDQLETEISGLNEQVESLEEVANTNLTSGAIGGAIGVLLILGLAYLVTRLGSSR